MDLGFDLPSPAPAHKESAITDATFNASEVSELARTNPDFLCALAMPTIFQYFWPPVFRAVWDWLLGFVHTSRTFPMLALGLPRGFGKTTLIKLFILYCILFTNRKFILVIAATATLAENILSDVCDMLDEPNIKKVFGDWKLGIEKDTQPLKKFGFRGRNIILGAIGAGGSIRGMNLKNERPDVMIFEDIQKREEADSPQVSEALEKWLYGTAIKAKSPLGCMFIFVGNMYPTKWSLLKRIKANPVWTKFIAGGILADGTSLWEDLQPIEQLKAEFQADLAAGHPEIFYAEVLNDENASTNTLVDISKLPPYRFAEDEPSVGNFIVIDPATDKTNADAVAIAYFEIHDTLPVLKELVQGRFSPGDTILTALGICLRKNCRVVGIESNAYQYSLHYWFDYLCQQRGITGILSVELYSGVVSKISRILTMFKQYTAGEIYVHPSCQAAVHLEITQFNPLKRDNVDNVLDTLTYAPKMIEIYGHLIQSDVYIIEAETAAIRVRDSSETSPF